MFWSSVVNTDLLGVERHRGVSKSVSMILSNRTIHHPNHIIQKGCRSTGSRVSVDTPFVTLSPVEAYSCKYNKSWAENTPSLRIFQQNDMVYLHITKHNKNTTK